MSAELSTSETPGKRVAGTWPRRAALVVIAALAGLSYAWSMNQDTLEPYYAAAVRSMSGSWHDFIFGAVDPAGTITLDKLPGAFWVQALAVRAFGFHTWVIVAPQAIEGVLTVFFLYRAVSRLAGYGAGLLAALILAASPATVALNRGNISDSLMILLLVLAADSVSAALTSSRSQWRLVLVGLWVGLAFQAKMIEAWLVLPALGLAYLLDGQGTAMKRARQLAVAGVVAGLVSLAWMTAVTLVPASSRPYVDGSHDDSVYEQVFVYNGFGRFGDQTPLQLLAAQVAEPVPIPPATPARLLRGNLGRDTGWLLPAALIAGIGGLLSRRRRPRGDGMRACFVLWGCWLLTLVVVFSAATYVNTYYTAALSPPVAALLAAAAVAVYRAGHRWAAALGVVVAGTIGYAVWLVPSTGAHRPGWLVPAIIAVGAAAVLAAAVSLAVRRCYPAAVAAGLAALLFAPAVASAITTASHESAFDTPYESQHIAQTLAGVPAQLARIARVTIPRLERFQDGAPDLMAAQTSAIASVFIYASGKEVLPIGGFTGTIPEPTLGQLRADVAAGDFRWVLAINTTDPRMRWLAGHCRSVGPHSYFCPGAVGAAPGVSHSVTIR